MNHNLLNPHEREMLTWLLVNYGREYFLSLALNTTPYRWNGSGRRNLGFLYEGGYLHRVIDDDLFSYALTDKAIKELQDGTK